MPGDFVSCGFCCCCHSFITVQGTRQDLKAGESRGCDLGEGLSEGFTLPAARRLSDLRVFSL